MTYDFYSHARIGVTRIYTREAIAQLFLLPRPCGRDHYILCQSITNIQNTATLSPYIYFRSQKLQKNRKKYLIFHAKPHSILMLLQLRLPLFNSISSFYYFSIFKIIIYIFKNIYWFFQESESAILLASALSSALK